MTGPAGSPVPPAGPNRLRTVLLAVIAVGLVLLGGGLAVVLDIGDDGPDVPSADSVDAGFSRDLARHHLQGVEMANLALERTEDPEVRQLAFDISATQTHQVGQMEGWLALWGIPPSGGDPMSWMADGGHAGHTMPTNGLMPGMATEAELAELRGLTGNEFDVQFLRLMIRHHQGGREMAEYAADHAMLPVVANLARTIAETQTAETTTMTDMLSARGGTPLPAP